MSSAIAKVVSTVIIKNEKPNKIDNSTFYGG